MKELKANLVYYKATYVVNEEVEKMDCNYCGGKMTKLKYLHYEELEGYLMNEYVPSVERDYKEWLMLLNENDLILTCFRREDYTGIKEKYYLRRIEKKTVKGIKLKGLSKIFKYEDGKIAYGTKDKIYSILTTYKVLPITRQVDKVIRDYCKSGEKFDIDNLNKIITKELSQ